MNEATDNGLPPLVVVCGPTASGKTGLAVELARRFPVEVVSADSRQVYRYMDIGTAKPTTGEREAVTHHLVDVVDPDEEFTAADFVALGRKAVDSIHAKGKLPLIVGGTGLYILALTDGLVPAPGASPELRSQLKQREEQEEGALYALLQQHDPEAAERMTPADQVRIIRALEVFFQSGKPLSEWQREHAFKDRPYRTLSLGLQPPREQLYERIDERTEIMMNEGLVEETRSLLGRGYAPDLKAMQTLGYRECQDFIRGEASYEETVERIQLQTRRYAKRQMTWFRKYPINWFESSQDFGSIVELIDAFTMK